MNILFTVGTKSGRREMYQHFSDHLTADKLSVSHELFAPLSVEIPSCYDIKINQISRNHLAARQNGYSGTSERSA